MQDLRITLIQTDLIWEEAESNISSLDEKIERIDGTHLIILPEMFTTGFSMNAKDLAEKMDGFSVGWLRRKAQQKNADVVGSLMINEGGKYFNRLVWAKPHGELITYDKRHLFRISGEEGVYSSGGTRITVELHGWRLRPFICYDLRFPLWTRNRGNEFDVAIFLANWPEDRSSHWKVLLQARSIENQCYVIGVNRVGIDGRGSYHSGDSSVIDPYGSILFQKGHEECIHTAHLSYQLLRDCRDSFPVWMDADPD
jgi:omega-amidase